MNRVHKIIPALLLLFCLLLSACNKPKLSEGSSRCLNDRIKEFSKTACDDARADEYRFQGNTVYVLESGTCVADGTSEVVNDNCDHLGWLGGITGNTTINGEDFQSAMFIRTVWEK